MFRCRFVRDRPPQSLPKPRRWGGDAPIVPATGLGPQTSQYSAREHARSILLRCTRVSGHETASWVSSFFVSSRLSCPPLLHLEPLADPSVSRCYFYPPASRPPSLLSLVDLTRLPLLLQANPRSSALPQTAQRTEVACCCRMHSIVYSATMTSIIPTTSNPSPTAIVPLHLQRF
jgi:hypothetical protein